MAGAITNEEPYLRSTELTEVTYCSSNGLPARDTCSETYRELFLEGTGPETGNKINLGDAIESDIAIPVTTEKKAATKAPDFFEGDDE